MLCYWRYGNNNDIDICYYYIYGFIQYYKTIKFVFCDKSSYCNGVTQTQTESDTAVLQTQAECIHKFAHIELVI